MNIQGECLLHRERQESGMKEMWHKRNEELGMLGAWGRVQSTEPRAS